MSRNKTWLTSIVKLYYFEKDEDLEERDFSIIVEKDIDFDEKNISLTIINWDENEKNIASTNINWNFENIIENIIKNIIENIIENTKTC